MQHLQTQRTGRHPRVAVLNHADGCDMPSGLLHALAHAGIEAETAQSSGELYRLLLGQAVSVVIVHADAVDDSGQSLIRNLRQASAVGIVASLRPNAGLSPTDVIERGADAWFEVPVEASAIVATLRGLMRRLDSDAATVHSDDSGEARTPRGTHGWRLDTAGWCLLSPDDQAVALTASERAVLSTLMEGGGTPLSREQLMNSLDDDEPGNARRRLEMLVFRLRRKVLERTGHVLPLLTARGNGYLFLDHVNGHRD
jgi:two-component system response regulator PhoP